MPNSSENKTKKSKYFDILISILNGELTIQEFMNQNHLSYSQFMIICQKALEQKYPEYFLQITKLIEEDKQRLTMRYKDLACYLEAGITVDNITRPFDLLDFFMLFGDINYKSGIFRILGLDRAEISAITIFFDSLQFSTKMYPNDFIKGIFKLNIRGEFRALTEDEIRGIISFMEENNIPLYDVLFNIAVRRYANNTLDITPLQPLQS